MQVTAGKTSYSGKVIAINKEQQLYKIRYDGQGANRDEWHTYKVLESIVSSQSGRRSRRQPQYYMG